MAITFLEQNVKLIGYVRVSSEGQLDGYGLDVQRAAIEAWVKNNQHTLTRVVADVGISGATDALDRPGLSECLASISLKEVEGLVVARLDRLARALTIQEATLAVVWRGGGEVFAADHGRVLCDDPDDPMRTALRQVVGVFAELDRRMTVKRLRDGRAAKAASRRKAVGAYAYGTRPEGRGRDRDAGVHPDEQRVVQRMLTLREQGLAYRAIAAQLADEGLMPRRASSWSPATVRRILLRNAPTDRSVDASQAKSPEPP